MTVLDAYAVIAYLRDEPAAGEVRPLLQAGDCALTAVGVAEVLDHLIRLAGADEEEAVLDSASSDSSTESPSKRQLAPQLADSERAITTASVARSAWPTPSPPKLHAPSTTLWPPRTRTC